jgi:hypothetical protein
MKLYIATILFAPTAYMNINAVHSENTMHDIATYQDMWAEGKKLMQQSNALIPSLLRDPNVPVNFKTQFRKLKRRASLVILEDTTMRTLRKSLQRLRSIVKKYESLLERIPESTES